MPRLFNCAMDMGSDRTPTLHLSLETRRSSSSSNTWITSRAPVGIKSSRISVPNKSSRKTRKSDSSMAKSSLAPAPASGKTRTQRVLLLFGLFSKQRKVSVVTEGVLMFRFASSYNGSRRERKELGDGKDYDLTL